MEISVKPIQQIYRHKKPSGARNRYPIIEKTIEAKLG
jgi:hypothetical protein